MAEILIPGPTGRLQGRYHQAKQPDAPAALLLAPHPKYNGTLSHPTLVATQAALAENGWSVLRINYRGVGRSQGQYGNGEGELNDAAAALDWLQSYNPHARAVWVGGFSFGAWICMQLLMRRPEIDSFISIAPPAHHYDFSFLAPCPSSGLIVHGGKDTQIPESSVAKLVAKLALQKDINVTYRLVPQANHFFSDHLEDLKKHIAEYVENTTAAMMAA